MVVEFIFHDIVDRIQSKKDKPRFFINELLFKGFLVNSDGVIETRKNNKGKEKKVKQYQLEGRLVGNTQDFYLFDAIKFCLPNNCKWEKLGSNYTLYKKNDEKQKGEKQWDPKGESKEPAIDDDTLEIQNLEKLGRSTSYKVIGNYTAINNLTEKSFDVYSEKLGEKPEYLRVIKCPNIREKWLIFYIAFSVVIIVLGIASILICCKAENWNHIISASPNLKIVFYILSVVFLFITGFFIVVFWKCLSACYILIKMKKFGVPKKDPQEPVSGPYLIPRIIQYMTGTEKVDNLL